LDEPTTHLDMVQRKSLGHLLAAFPGSILLVDRDRALLDSVVNRVFELRDARLRTIEGDYQDYERQLRLSMREQQHKIYQTSRIQRKETHSRTEHTAVRHADRHLSSNSTDTAERKQVPVVQVSRLTKSFARRPLLDNVTFSVHLGERVALLGPAGSGKTVLLRIIAGEISPDKGNIKLAAGLRLGYVPQVVTKTPETGLSEDNTDSNSSTTVSPATPLSDVQQLTQECDILLLDNPTQLLDIDSIIALEELLLQFPGTLLFATHDRALARKLATRLLVFNKGIIDDRSSIANHSLISS
ncbi:MAG: ATP-binding cassette domain-containing protein, partial [candidate division WOR-3 bacterium]